MPAAAPSNASPSRLPTPGSRLPAPSKRASSLQTANVSSSSSSAAHSPAAPSSPRSPRPISSSSRIAPPSPPRRPSSTVSTASSRSNGTGATPSTAATPAPRASPSRSRPNSRPGTSSGLSTSRRPSTASVRRSPELGVGAVPAVGPRAGQPPNSRGTASSSGMPPPRVPARKSSAQHQHQQPQQKKTMDTNANAKDEKKKGAFGRAGSIFKRATGKKEDKPKKEDKKVDAKAAEKAEKEKKTLGKSLGFRSSTNLLKNQQKPEEKTKLGRTMSLRSSASLKSKESLLDDSASIDSKSSLRRPMSYAAPKTATTAADARKPSMSKIQQPTSTVPTRAGGSLRQTKPRPAFNTSSIEPPAAPESVKAAPKPPKTPPPPPLDQSTIYKQIQLLQLLVLYSTADASYNALCVSATQQLQSRFSELSTCYAQERTQLLELQKAKDLAGLAAVVESPNTDSSRSPEEKIQSFSEALKRLEALQANEYRRVEKKFGEWIAGYSPPSPLPYGTQRDYIMRRGKWVDGLGDVWRKDAVNVCRRIETSVRGVEAVCQAVFQAGGEEAGVVGCVAQGWVEVAKGLLEECEIMRRMEREITERERGVLKGAVDSLTGVAGSRGMEGGVWTRC